MDIGTIKNSLIDEIRFEPIGDNCFYIRTPFRFNDGECLCIILKQENNQWVLSDGGHTFFNLTYDISEKQLFSGTRQTIISNTLKSFDIVNREGELILPIRNGNYGDALCDFIQSLLKITTIESISWEHSSRGAFRTDFRRSVLDFRRDYPIQFDWYNETYDQKRKYKVDCKIQGEKRPVYVYALSSEKKTDEATISLHQFKDWKILFYAIGVFDNRRKISSKAIDCFQDVANEYCSLNESQAKIKQLLTYETT